MDTPEISRKRRQLTTSLLDDQRFADLELKCGKRSWRVHLAIVCAASPRLSSLCGSEIAMQVEATSLILGDQVPSAVDAMIRFIYTGDYDDDDYDDSEYDDISVSCPALHDVYVHSIATKLQIRDLAKLAEHKFANHLDNTIYTPGFAEAVKEIYTTTPEDKVTLQQLVLHRCNKNIAAILAPYGKHLPVEWLPFIHLRRIKQEVPEFVIQLANYLPWALNSVGQRASDGKFTMEERYKCSACENTFVMQSVAFAERRNFWCPHCGKEASRHAWQEMVTQG